MSDERNFASPKDALLSKLNSIVDELNDVCLAIEYEPLIEKLQTATKKDFYALGEKIAAIENSPNFQKRLHKSKPGHTS